MDHGSPNKNLNKGYKSESVKAERSNLMNDNPVAKDASGGRPMILKHMSGSKGSPLMAHLSDSQEKKLPSELKAAMHK